MKEEKKLTFSSWTTEQPTIAAHLGKAKLLRIRKHLMQEVLVEVPAVDEKVHLIWARLREGILGAVVFVLGFLGFLGPSHVASLSLGLRRG